MDVDHIRTGTRIMADVIFNLPEGRHSTLPTMEHPDSYVVTRLMAHMGAYTQVDLKRLHWRWHHRVTLRIPEALIRHRVWTIRTPLPRGPLTPDRATGHQRQRSPTAQGPPRQVARTGN